MQCKTWTREEDTNNLVAAFEMWRYKKIEENTVDKERTRNDDDEVETYFDLK